MGTRIFAREITEVSQHSEEGDGIEGPTEKVDVEKHA
jgi:hypothetical protein